MTSTAHSRQLPKPARHLSGHATIPAPPRRGSRLTRRLTPRRTPGRHTR